MIESNNALLRPDTLQEERGIEVTRIDRVVLIVLDSVGVGALPDAAEYGDEDPFSNTLANTAQAVGGLHLPAFQRLGLGNILPVQGVPAAAQPAGAFGRMAEKSKGKDTTTGHWEIAGVVSDSPMPTYPDGFPSEVISSFERAIGRSTLGNYAASGTVIIQDLGDEHVRTGSPVVYTSADSVFQIAAHEEIIPLDELYRICETARAILSGPHNVGRVIARPFVGPIDGKYVRTENRRDFSALPPHPTLLDQLVCAGRNVMAVGKIEDIFAHRGITDSIHSTNNMAGVDATIEFLRKGDPGLVLANLVDFDVLYGHRNNPRGYADALEAVDQRLPELLANLAPQDVLFFTADHGNDPTTSSTDHSREYVPLLATGSPVIQGTHLGTRESFADLGTTIAELLGVAPLSNGISFCRELIG